jgi:aspartyl-tRNA(Asn)/glutamyl-tRNA(Gln) amidotransferase subunit A
MGVIAGHDPNDPTSAHEPVPDYEAMLDGKIKGMRIGVPTTYFFDDADAEIVAAIDAAVAVLKEAGAEIVKLPMPRMDAVSTYGSIISRVESAAIHGEWMRRRPSDYSVHLSARIYSGMAVPAAYYVEALSRRGPILKAFCREVFDKVDAFVAPTMQMPVPKLADTDIDRRGAPAINAFNAITSNTRVINSLGLPSVSAPCGFDRIGLPIGLMIQGRPFAEGRILKIADAYQRMTRWHEKRPDTAA